MYRTAETLREKPGARAKKQTNSEGGLVVDFADIYHVKFADESPTETSSEMALFDEFFEQFSSPTLLFSYHFATHDGPFFRQSFWLLLFFRPVEAHPKGSLANASLESPTARRQPPPADRTTQADDYNSGDQGFSSFRFRSRGELRSESARNHHCGHDRWLIQLVSGAIVRSAC
jgi:hypothetical protein